MKNLLYISFLLLIVSCNGQNKTEDIVSATNDSIPFNEDFAFLIGKWKHIESISSDGATKYTTEIKNGQTLIFEINGNVIIEKESTKDNGTYKIQLRDTNRKDRFKLCISSSKGDLYYIFFFGGNSNKISLTPVTPEYEIICDEGCPDIYEKIK